MLRPAVALTIVAFAVAVAHIGAAVQSARDITGRWSGPMMLEVSKGRQLLVTIEVELEQRGSRLRGRWRTSAHAAHRAGGELSGTIGRLSNEEHVEVDLTFVGRHPGMPTDREQSCTGSGRAVGQHTRATRIDATTRRAADPMWLLRLKAFDGFMFESCRAIPYATVTLERARRPAR
jgi:hypothetical protein